MALEVLIGRLPLLWMELYRLGWMCCRDGRLNTEVMVILVCEGCPVGPRVWDEAQ